MSQFPQQQLGQAIIDLQQSHYTGVAHIETFPNVLGDNRSTLLVLQNGELTYCGLSLPNPTEFSQTLGQYFNLEIMDTALQLAQKRLDDHTSVRNYLELFIRLKLFTWQDVETYVQKQTILRLEQIFPYAGKIILNTSTTLDLTYGEDKHGFTWQQIEPDIMKRQQVWASLTDTIPGINAIPYQLRLEKNKITDPWVQQHLSQWVNGQRSLCEIASQLKIDPLDLAHKYLKYVQKDWITFEQEKYLSSINKLTTATPLSPPQFPKKQSTTERSALAQPVSKNHRSKESSQYLATILSVDDSPVVQAMIKRAIGDSYRVLLASNAMDALSLLNTETIELLLLDVTMPDIDGLELCRTIRGINRFRELPIVMLTAKGQV